MATVCADSARVGSPESGKLPHTLHTHSEADGDFRRQDRSIKTRTSFLCWDKVLTHPPCRPF